MMSLIRQVAFELISIMAVMTNCALIGMNPEVRKLLPSDITAVNIVLIFVAVEVWTTVMSKCLYVWEWGGIKSQSSSSYLKIGVASFTSVFSFSVDSLLKCIFAIFRFQFEKQSTSSLFQTVKVRNVSLQHIILAIKVAVACLIPDQPKWVEIELAKIAYQSKLALQEKVCY